MSRTTRRPPISGAKTRQPARRAVATLAVALLFGLAASEARAVIAFVKNIGTNSSATTDTTIAVTVPAAGVSRSAQGARGAPTPHRPRSACRPYIALHVRGRSILNF